MRTLLFTIIFLKFCVTIYAHGRSEEMVKKLHAPVPEWLSLAEAIKVDPIEGGMQKIDQSKFRPRSGGATNSANRLQIPRKGIDVQLDYNIDYFGKNEKGQGVSLSPDETKIIVNSGIVARLYKVADGNQLKEIPIHLPHVTYDKGLKGFITKWSWASDDVLIGNSCITDEQGHSVLENRIYAYHQESKSLARLDLSALNLDAEDPPVIEVESIGKDLSELVLNIGGELVLVSVDLKAPHKLLKRDNSFKRTERIKPPREEGLPSSPSSRKLLEKSERTELVTEKSYLPWVIAGVLLIGILVFLLRMWNKPSK